VSVSTVIHTSRPTDAPGLFDCSPALVERPVPRFGPNRRAANGTANRNNARRGGAVRPATAKRGQTTMQTQSERARYDVRPLPPIPQAARDLLADAARGLGRAIRATEAADRYAAAHLAALRAALALRSASTLSASALSAAHRAALFRQNGVQARFMRCPPRVAGDAAAPRLVGGARRH